MAAVIEQLAPGHALSDELARLVAEIQRSVVLVRGTRHSAGSGVVWGESGAIVSNHHVVPRSEAEIVLPDGTRAGARVTRRSEALDLVALAPEGDPNALTSILSPPSSPARVRDSATLRPGEIVLAVGNPLGERNVATLGYLVSAPDATEGVVRAAVTLRPGNSGGALADANGHLVGIPHVVMRGGLAQAVSSRAVQGFLEGDGTDRPVLGVSGQWVEVPAAVRDRAGVVFPTGLLVAEVSPGGVADTAGILLGDILVGFADGDGPGDPVPLTALRIRRQYAPLPRRLALIRAGELRWIATSPLVPAPPRPAPQDERA
jgi:serine protease Do